MIISQIYLMQLLLKYREGSFANVRFTGSSSDRSNRVVFDSENANLSGSGGKVNTKRFNGGGNLPTFEVVVQPPSPTSSSSNQGSSNNVGGNGNGSNRPSSSIFDSSKSSRDERGKYSSLKTSHSDDPTNLSNSSVQDNEEEDQEEDTSPVSLFTRTKRNVMRSFKRSVPELQSTSTSGTGFLRIQNNRPFNFWKWSDFSTYLIFISIFIVSQGILYLLLGGFPTYISILGYIALGLESTLPIPQLISNQKRKSLSGFSVVVLGGWVIGDTFKLGYFLVRKSPIQFIVCSIFQLSIDLVICTQFWFFREKTKEDDEIKERENEIRRRENGEAGREQEWVEPTNNLSSQVPKIKETNLKGKSGSLRETDPFVLEEEDEEDGDDEDWKRNAWSQAGNSRNNGVGEVEADESEEENNSKSGKGKGRA